MAGERPAADRTSGTGTGTGTDARTGGRSAGRTGSHPLWRLAFARPQLLAAHLGGYSALVRGEAPGSAAALRRRAWLAAVCLGGFTSASVLLGVAVIGWAAGIAAPPWLLLAVPAVPGVLAVAALLALRRDPPLPLWSALQAQWAADAEVLKRHEP